QVEGAGPTIDLDGVRLGTAALGLPIPVDPGPHLVEARAGGKKPWSKRLTTRPASLLTIAVPALENAKTEPPSTVSVSASSPPSPLSLPSSAGPSRDVLPTTGSDHSAARRTAYILGATGSLFLLAGSYFGVRAKLAWDERNAHCQDGCDQTAVDAWE